MHKLMMLERCFGVHYDHPQAQPTEEVLCTVFEGEPVTGSLGACVLHFTTTLQPLCRHRTRQHGMMKQTKPYILHSWFAVPLSKAYTTTLKEQVLHKRRS